MTYDFTSGEELLALCETEGISIATAMLRREETDEQTLYREMRLSIDTMRAAIEKGLCGDNKTLGGIIGTEAHTLASFDKSSSFCGKTVLDCVAASMAVLEVNASMGLIVAAPTAGASGILPGTLFTLAPLRDWSDEQLADALFAASAVGYLFARNATISGAEGGCQAETGTAAAMTAAALCQLAGASPEASLHAAAMTIKNILGQVCDPVAGLVECPCQKRNAIGVVNAMLCADLAIAGIRSIIPFDEVVDAMLRVGRALPYTLRETAQGGLATTPTGKAIAQRIFG